MALVVVGLLCLVSSSVACAYMLSRKKDPYKDLPATPPDLPSEPPIAAMLAKLRARNEGARADFIADWIRKLLPGFWAIKCDCWYLNQFYRVTVVDILRDVFSKVPPQSRKVDMTPVREVNKRINAAGELALSKCDPATVVDTPINLTPPYAYERTTVGDLLLKTQNLLA